MIKYLIRLLLLIVITAFVSCDNNSNDTTTYFGGKIINPKSKFVVLFYMDKVIDTLFIDSENKFLGKLENVKEGLYYFKHGVENQSIYLEPKDSLMLRLNTWDFDESIVFAGKGAERNNILIDCFLENEKDNKKFYQLYKLEPNNFLDKVNKMITLKEKAYQKYIENHPNETIDFKNVLKIALTYPLFSRIERYPIVHFKKNEKEAFHRITDSFYTHRKSININNDALMYYPPYSQYVRNFLYNTTYALGHQPMTNEYSSDFTVDLLNTIDKNIKSKESKNAFLKQTVIGHFFKKSSCKVNKKAFNTYFNLSTNADDKNHVKQLLLDNEALHKGHRIKNFTVHKSDSEFKSIEEVIRNKNTFLFFWSRDYITPNYIAKRINYLSNKFPEVQFIEIEINGSQNNTIHDLEAKNQFFITQENEANKFLTSKMPRVVIVNKKGIVTNGFATISSRKLNRDLQELTKY
ncbi:hypothetical protein [uncultured Polaribacter sp.]|uniref:hypothetical protein n=1 Tax=uncultured Polaribacter sp. TaxID=174711 RepID=UPI0026267CE1|nr:hypothetical protein [uncultured Polaribacter sp.]